jgi:hypothetical protein
MKLLRILLVLLLVIPTLAPLRTARAAAADAVDAGSSNDGTASAPSIAPDPGHGPNTKGGVIAAAGCGFAIASLILMPNPLSAFAVGFDCGFFLIDAGYSPDR